MSNSNPNAGSLAGMVVMYGVGDSGQEPWDPGPWCPMHGCRNCPCGGTGVLQIVAPFVWPIAPIPVTVTPAPTGTPLERAKALKAELIARRAALLEEIKNVDEALAELGVTP